jgi:hypothetical protein
MIRKLSSPARYMVLFAGIVIFILLLSLGLTMDFIGDDNEVNIFVVLVAVTILVLSYFAYSRDYRYVYGVIGMDFFYMLVMGTYYKVWGNFQGYLVLHLAILAGCAYFLSQGKPVVKE